jgi:hypothetical protein
MERNRWAAVVAISLLAGSSGQAQVCYPQPFDVDPAYGNFSPVSWPDGNFNWVNNVVGGWLSRVWANTDFDMWFVGYTNATLSVAVHFDGFSLQPSPISGTGLLRAVWGSASNDVWAVGTNGMIVHWDGTQWVTIPSGTSENLFAVAGTAPDDVWAASGAVMLHWDGASWTNSPGFVPDYGGVAGLAAISRSDALVATDRGCQRWDGALWSATPCGVRGGNGIYAPASNDIWVVGSSPTCPMCLDDGYRAHWDGSSWTTTVAQGRSFGSIGGTGPTDIWIDGRLHYDGSSWTDNNCGPQFSSMSVSNNGAFIGVNRSGIEYFSGNDGWPFLARTRVDWIGMGGRDPSGLWAVGANGEVIVYDGSGWSGQNHPFPSGGRLFRAFGSSSSDIWAGGSTGPGISPLVLRHFDGRSWTDVDFPLDYYGFRAGFARTPNDAILVDGHDRAWHWDGASWFLITVPIFGNDQIGEFWGTAPDDVWAVGANFSEGTSAIYHWDGDSWQLIYRTPVGGGLIDHVAGTARDDVWFSVTHFSSGRVLHWDGTSIVERRRFNYPVVGIAASGPNDVWFKNYYPYRSFTHYDGVDWTLEPVSITLDGLWGVPGAGVFSFGGVGQIYHHR